MDLSPLPPVSQRHGPPLWLVWLVVIVLAGILVWPWAQGRELRRMAAQKRIDSNWRPDYRLLPLMGLAHQQSMAGGGRLTRSQRDQLWREVEAYKGTYPVFFWIELAWLEARAGDLERAKQALDRAERQDNRLFRDMTKSRLWDPWRERFGLPRP
ncbi:MAG: hypothetical protein K9K66_16295 [Desulfarculaceae bacterium]|nr:hypothetical protein [Desulfarculaceae bacterium]MCF8073347.1 hypothetical protein [Desulfarculaceae bacterium]MCF8103217.1 hypothetical protein [Desulfarculaceae bacterium]MCF8116601.1 hypothetical protein [Desulfarculaceae bacterium]